MTKLLPPLIEGTIPAFYRNENGTATLTVPFSMNRGVSSGQITGFSLKLKTTQSSNYLFTLDSQSYNIENSPYAIFNLSKDNVNKLKIGQFYKIQLAYIDSSNEVGHYSSAGVIKFTSKPEVSIARLEDMEINSHLYEYTGLYSQTEDKTERVYSYEFILYNSIGEIIAESGQLLHNSSNDTEIDSSYDEFLFSQELELNKSYYIKYVVHTNNGLVISSPRYRIMQKISIDPEIEADLSIDLNFENGYVNIHLIGHKNEYDLEEPATGAFLLTRACSDTNYSVWDEISRFKLAAQTPSRQLWRDLTVEQGKTYKYSLQQYNDVGLYSNRILSNELYVDFEHAFLYDGKRQLKIKYNPKVSSFKANVLESKIDTIGSKHPFIFRNGRVYYHEFPISGLISYLMDEEKMFLNDNEFTVEENTTNLIGSNIQAERTYKMRVLEWLTNGEPKLFRSPGEGNFIVRLMNSSLTPNDTVGRMLHTFNCTAYEIAEFNYHNLGAFNFIQLKDPEVATLRWETVELKNILSKGPQEDKKYYLNKNHIIYTLRLSDMAPGTRVHFKTENGQEESILIGITGSYYLDIGIPIKEVWIEQIGQTYYPQGSMTYSFYSIAQNNFDKIADVKVSEVPARQFIGEHNIINEIEYVQNENGEWLKNPKVDIIEFYHIQARKRHIEKIYKDDNGSYFADEKNTIALREDPFELYQVGYWQNKESSNINPGYRPGYPNREFIVKAYYDPATGIETSMGSYQYNSTVEIDESQVSVFETEDFELHKPGKLIQLKSNNGTVIECSYQVRTIEYSIESNGDYQYLIDAKKAYENCLNNIKTLLDEYDDNETNTLNGLEDYYNQLPGLYTTYILSLIKAQEEEKKAEGLI